MPPASIPAPQATLPQPNSRMIIAYSADAKEGTVPIVGESEVIDPMYRDGTYQVAITTEEIAGLAPQRIQKSRALAAYLQRFSVLPSAGATSIDLAPAASNNQPPGNPGRATPASPVAPSGGSPAPAETFDPTTPTGSAS